MKVLSVASECVPFVKTGGLADVVGALPGALAPLGVEMRVLMPSYMIPECITETSIEEAFSGRQPRSAFARSGRGFGRVRRAPPRTRPRCAPRR